MAPIEKFYTANSRLDLTGKTALIVGGTQGIGKAVALRMSALGASVTIVGRNEKLGAEVINELKVRSPGFAEDKATFSFHKADVSLMSEVKRFITEIKPQYEKTGLNYLFLTAGYPPNDTSIKTAEGIDRQFAVQSLARFVTIELLVPVLKKAHGGARVIDIMAPGGAKNVEFLEDIEFQKRPYSFVAALARDAGYHDLMCKAFTARYATFNIQFHHIFPGIVDTGAVKSMPWYVRILASIFIPFLSVKAEDYAETPVYAATSEEFAVSGKLLSEKLQEIKVAEAFNDPAHGDRLWTYSIQRAGLE
ncbi:hypothetical protein BC937DRAFT_91498 [Endogone sp. FLAS-F59071]|nr:hypothetical protein BC937DRAFT_91498 [Endogone sp. FLAS-F59071]|eukprot:RUS21764.1 hypothetical protein BC937DRAFT_91498 [Endogone sp. FLAS-F59071]